MQVLVASALASGGASAADVGFVALHGTGTPLGDPIEIGALAQALACSVSQRDHATCLSSVKVSLRTHDTTSSGDNALKHTLGLKHPVLLCLP